MTTRLLLLLALLGLGTTLPDMDDNMVPSDEEILQVLLEQERGSRPVDQGQPEVEDSLGLPTDEDSYNELKTLFALRPGYSGTHHFVSSSFPEVDARGFHESVFDGFGDYFPPWRRQKRDPLGINSRGFHDDVFNRDFGAFHTVKRSNMKHSSVNEQALLNKYMAPLQRTKREVDGDHTKTNDKHIPYEPKFEKELPSVGHKEQHEPGTKYRRDTSRADVSDAADKRRPEMDSSGFHGDTFRGGFGDFWTMKRKDDPNDNTAGNSSTFYDDDDDDDYWDMHKRRLGMGPSGFHGDTFTSGFGDFSTMKKSNTGSNSEADMDEPYKPQNVKRKPEMGSSGFHGDTFTNGFGDFWTMKRDIEHVKPGTKLGRLEHKRRPEMDSSGFHGDTFKSGFGDFWTMKKRKPEMDSSGFHGDTFRNGVGDLWTMKKRRPEMDSSGFHGDTFRSGFGDFWTMKKRKPEMDSSGFHGDTFNSGFGDFWTMKKRRPEMDSSGFHGDTFKSGFGDFWTMKKRRPEMDSSGFHGDTFRNGFGDFWTMKKRRPEMDSSGFHGDTFNSGFGDFWPMKKRRPEMDSSGFHGDTFNSGFGDFWPMKKRKPEMDSSGFHGDTFRGGFGDFWTMKKRSIPSFNSTNGHNARLCRSCAEDSVNLLQNSHRSKSH